MRLERHGLQRHLNVQGIGLCKPRLARLRLSLSALSGRISTPQPACRMPRPYFETSCAHAGLSIPGPQPASAHTAVLLDYYVAGPKLVYTRRAI